MKKFKYITFYLLGLLCIPMLSFAQNEEEREDDLGDVSDVFQIKNKGGLNIIFSSKI